MTGPPSPNELDELLSVAQAVARGAGQVMMQLSESATRHLPGSDRRAYHLVADIEVESFIVEQLSQLRPRDGLISEEGAVVETQTGLTWVVDPIDGSMNFAHRLPGPVVSVAVQYRNESLVGAVFDPTHDELFSARARGGATRNGEQVSASSVSVLGDALVSTGFSHESEERRAQLQLIGRVGLEVADVRSSGVCAFDLCQVAAGRIDAYFESDLHVWDYAAGLLIASEAGAKTAVFKPKLVVSAAAGIAPQLMDLLGTHSS